MLFSTWSSTYVWVPWRSHEANILLFGYCEAGLLAYHEAARLCDSSASKPKRRTHLRPLLAGQPSPWAFWSRPPPAAWGSGSPARPRACLCTTAAKQSIGLAILLMKRVCWQSSRTECKFIGRHQHISQWQAKGSRKKAP